MRKLKRLPRHLSCLSPWSPPSPPKSWRNQPKHRHLLHRAARTPVCSHTTSTIRLVGLEWVSPVGLLLNVTNSCSLFLLWISLFGKYVYGVFARNCICELCFPAITFPWGFCLCTSSTVHLSGSWSSKSGQYFCCQLHIQSNILSFTNQNTSECKSLMTPEALMPGAGVHRLGLFYTYVLESTGTFL